MQVTNLGKQVNRYVTNAILFVCALPIMAELVLTVIGKKQK
jgi:hypothetical protein